MNKPPHFFLQIVIFVLHKKSCHGILATSLKCPTLNIAYGQWRTQTHSTTGTTVDFLECMSQYEYKNKSLSRNCVCVSILSCTLAYSKFQNGLTQELVRLTIQYAGIHLRVDAPICQIKGCAFVLRSTIPVGNFTIIKRRSDFVAFMPKKMTSKWQKYRNAKSILKENIYSKTSTFLFPIVLGFFPNTCHLPCP